MNAICGFHLREAGEAHGLDAMLAALGDPGEDGARWTEGTVGLGCLAPSRFRHRERPGRTSAALRP